MKTLDKIIAGLQLINTVEPNTYFSAEHDEIWCGGDIEKYSEEQKLKLKELGWDDNDVPWHRFV